MVLEEVVSNPEHVVQRINDAVIEIEALKKRLMNIAVLFLSPGFKLLCSLNCARCPFVNLVALVLFTKQARVVARITLETTTHEGKFMIACIKQA